MRNNGNTGPGLSSEVVNARFWALICDDEEWLRTEFDGIVGEPAEQPTSPPPRAITALDRDRPARFPRRVPDPRPRRHWVTRPRAGAPAGHQRSPPDPGVASDQVRHNDRARW
jgi:hypothetical protein